MSKKSSKTGTTRKRELIIFGVCFIAATILNVIGIISNKSPAKELVTQLHVVLVVSLVFYVFVIIFRVIYSLIAHLWIRK